MQPSVPRFSMMKVTPVRLGFWETGYNTPSRNKIGMKYWGLFYFWAVVSGPPFMIMLGNWPGLLAWFADRMRPVEYPPQADPTIIKTIYKNKVPAKTSMDSYKREGSRHPEANNYVEKTIGLEDGESNPLLETPHGHFNSDQEVDYLNLDTIKKPAEEFMKPI